MTTIGAGGQVVARQYRYKPKTRAEWGPWGNHEPSLAGYLDWEEQSRDLYAYPPHPADERVVERLREIVALYVDACDVRKEHQADVDRAALGDRS